MEWRLIYAGSVRMNLAHIKDKPEWEAKLHIESAGLVYCTDYRWRDLRDILQATGGNDSFVRRARLTGAMPCG